MSRDGSAVASALARMLEADDKKDGSRSSEDWEAWQRAAVDYWLALHPDMARFRCGDLSRVPTVDELRERAELVARARDGIPGDWRLASPSPDKAEHLARVGWFHELLSGLYGPVQQAMRRVEDGDREGVETLVRFLEADVYCFRSGYMKADVIRVVTRAIVDEPTASRLRRVVLSVVDGDDRREFRSYVRLGRRVDNQELRGELRSRLGSVSRRTARHAGWLLAGLGEAGMASSSSN